MLFVLIWGWSNKMPNLCWFYVVPSYYPLWQVDSIWKTTQVKFDLGMNPYVQCIVSPKQYVILDIWAKLFIAHWDFWCSGHASCILLNQCVSAEQAELFVEVQACQLILRDSGNGFALNISISNIMQDSGEPFYISLWSTYTFNNVFPYILSLSPFIEIKLPSDISISSLLSLQTTNRWENA